MKDFADLVTIGHIMKPQGRRGEVLVHVLSDRADRFETLERAFVAGPGVTCREVVVTSSWPHKGRVVLKLEGVDSINEAEVFRGAEIRIAPQPLAEGEYYHHQLRGLKVQDEAGRELGRVEGLIETGATMVLQIRDGEKETLVPLAEMFVRALDLGTGTMVVRVPEMVDAAH